MLIFAAPYWQGSTPEAITRECPIDIVCQPITIATALDSFWVPISLLILAHQGVFDLCSADVPRWLSVINKCSMAAPAMWVRVFVLKALIERTCRF